MSNRDEPPTMPSAHEVLDRGFLEARARILEVAAFLDRLDRAPGGEAAREDYRYRALRVALAELGNGGQRVAAVLRRLSDPSSEPVAKASAKGATGAWQGLVP